jgi:hypothetical protein
MAELGKYAEAWLLHVRGHSDIASNERCDHLAAAGRRIQEGTGTERNGGEETMRRAKDRVVEFQRQARNHELREDSAGGSKGTKLYLEMTGMKCLGEKPAERLKAVGGDPAAGRALHQARMGFLPCLYWGRTSYSWKEGGGRCIYCGESNVDVRHVFLSCADEKVAEWRALLEDGERCTWPMKTTAGIERFFQRLWYGSEKKQAVGGETDSEDSE